MLFDRRPKYRREDFYDREEELHMFLRGLEVGEGLIVVYGVRRVGKTSLVRVGLAESNIPFVPIDLRRFSEDPSLLSPSVSALLIEEVLKQYEKHREKMKKFVRDILRYVDSLDLKVVKLKVKEGRRRLLAEVLEEADRWAGKRGIRVAIVLDEAQELRTVPAWRDILAWTIDNLENVTFVVTGSEVGVLRDFLKLEDRDSPLFGRARLEINLRGFDRNVSVGFLRSGFREAGLTIDEAELADAVGRLNGIVGWLALYGYYRVSYGLSHKASLERVEADASELVADELEKLVKNAPGRYLAILWAVSLGLKKWST
ncbi:MAG: ATP-binding protein, partial [Thermoproteales archaeon]|nr:ATP-binding protein [Thermoproteales archaeon]